MNKAKQVEKVGVCDTKAQIGKLCYVYMTMLSIFFYADRAHTDSRFINEQQAAQQQVSVHDQNTQKVQLNLADLLSKLDQVSGDYVHTFIMPSGENVAYTLNRRYASMFELKSVIIIEKKMDTVITYQYLDLPSRSRSQLEAFPDQLAIESYIASHINQFKQKAQLIKEDSALGDALLKEKLANGDSKITHTKMLEDQYEVPIKVELLTQEGISKTLKLFNYREVSTGENLPQNIKVYAIRAQHYPLGSVVF